MEIVHSVIAARSIEQLLARSYALEGRIDCIHYESGSNIHYLVQCDQARYVLRVLEAVQPWNPEGDRIRSGVEYEIELLLFLRERGARACCPVPMASGGYVGEIEAAEGRRYFSLFHFIDGNAPGVFDTPRAFRFGEAVAQLHRQAAPFSTELFKYRIGPEYLLDATLQRFRDCAQAPRPEAIPYLIQVAADIRAAMATLPCRPPIYGPIHGDIHVGNAFEHEDGGFSFIDFETAGPGWRIYDIATFTGMLKMGWGPKLASDVSTETITQSFLAGYQRDNPLHETELRVLPQFERARLFEFLGFWMFEHAHGRRGLKNCQKHVDIVVDELERWDGLRSSAQDEIYRPLSLAS